MENLVLSFAAPNYEPYRTCLTILNIARFLSHVNTRLRHDVSSIGRIIRGSNGYDLKNLVHRGSLNWNSQFLLRELAFVCDCIKPFLYIDFVATHYSHLKTILTVFTISRKTRDIFADIFWYIKEFNTNIFSSTVLEVTYQVLLENLKKPKNVLAKLTFLVLMK